jgi:hypothetical protein
VLIGYFKINGQVVFGIYLGLNVVGHFSDVVSGNHLPTVGVGGGDLGVSAFFQFLLQLLVFAAMRLVFFDFLLGFIGVNGVAVFHGQFKVVKSLWAGLSIAAAAGIEPGGIQNKRPRNTLTLFLTIFQRFGPWPIHRNETCISQSIVHRPSLCKLSDVDRQFS